MLIPGLRPGARVKRLLQALDVVENGTELSAGFGHPVFDMGRNFGKNLFFENAETQRKDGDFVFSSLRP